MQVSPLGLLWELALEPAWTWVPELWLGRLSGLAPACEWALAWESQLGWMCALEVAPPLKWALVWR